MVKISFQNLWARKRRLFYVEGVPAPAALAADGTGRDDRNRFVTL